MPEWRRAPVDTLCGGPHADPVTIKRGDPVMVFTLPGMRTSKVRCRHCAGEPPPDLPALVERSTAITPMVRLPTGKDALPFDWRAAQAGGREPGEEG